MKIVFDTCVINQLYKNKVSLKNVLAMNFQKKEIFSYIKKDLAIEFLEKQKNEHFKKKDLNFLLLDRKEYTVFTFDKGLKKILRTNKYNTCVNITDYYNQIN